MTRIRKRLLAVVSTVAVVAMAAVGLTASVAQAADPWGGSNPAYTWTTGNGVYYEYGGEIAGVTSGPETICVSPVQWNGSKFVFPWGWQCKHFSVGFSHPLILAAHGVYNPNGSRQYFNAEIF